MTDAPKVTPALTPEEWADPRNVMFSHIGPLEMDEEARHALAALALYGTKEGFTRKMLHSLIDLINLQDPESIEEILADCRLLAARIEALLPPGSARSG